MTRHDRKLNPWTETIENELVAAFERGDSFGVIAKAIGRSELAVQARLLRLGKITPEQMGLHHVG